MLVHATCVALRPHGKPSARAWRAVLLRGPSGAGKSDLALRLIEAGGRLVADDQTRLARHGRGLVATAPTTLAGLIEVRGVGIVKLARGQLLARAPLALLVDLVTPDRIERLPEPARRAAGRHRPARACARAVRGVGRHQVASCLGANRGRMIAAVRAMPDSPTPSAPTTAHDARRPFVVVTGLSGAGRATALNVLDDLGYVAVDNVPLPLLGDIDALDRRPPGRARGAARLRRRHAHLRLRRARSGAAPARAAAQSRPRTPAAVPRLRHRDAATALHRIATASPAGARPSSRRRHCRGASTRSAGCATRPTS